MFNGIAPRYDMLNRLLSLRRDVAWREALVAHLPGRPGLRVLDVATGTGDVLLALNRQRRPAFAVGADVAEAMLALAGEKARRQACESIRLVRSDAMSLAFDDGSFDAVTMAFGIRNVADVQGALVDMRRVLAPGGRAIVLEFSVPANRAIRPVYLLYLRHILPRLGGLISGDRNAYHYLNRTIESFPCGEAFCALMTAAGFENAKAHPLTLGIATVYTGERNTDV
jgi:demethylmenaquinone methyltransferase / 2-methoxy-6-polyprenyl-1,4-benzoquinol methylase